MAQQRWAADAQMDADTRNHFETADLDEAMEAYQQMRKTYESVGKILDTRFQAERQQDECCSNPDCRKKFDRNTPWYYRQAVRDPLTQRMYNEFACCQACMIVVKQAGSQKRIV